MPPCNTENLCGGHARGDRRRRGRRAAARRKPNEHGHDRIARPYDPMNTSPIFRKTTAVNSVMLQVLIALLPAIGAYGMAIRRSHPGAIPLLPRPLR